MSDIKSLLPAALLAKIDADTARVSVRNVTDTQAEVEIEYATDPTKGLKGGAVGKICTLDLSGGDAAVTLALRTVDDCVSKMSRKVDSSAEQAAVDALQVAQPSPPTPEARLAAITKSIASLRSDLDRLETDAAALGKAKVKP